MNDKSWVVVFATGFAKPNRFFRLDFIEKGVIKHQIAVIMQDKVSVVMDDAEFGDLGAPYLLSAWRVDH